MRLPHPHRTKRLEQNHLGDAVNSETSLTNQGAREFGAPTREAQRRNQASDAYLSAHSLAFATKSSESLGLLRQLLKRPANT